MYYLDLGEKTGVIKRVSLEGGEPETVLESESTLFSLSPDDKTILTDEVRDADHKVVLTLHTIGGKESRSIDADPRALPGHVFMPDGKGAAYIVREKGVDNIWIQPLDGSPNRQLTHFTAESISSFAFSLDGSKMAFGRGHMESDAILLRDTSR